MDYLKIWSYFDRLEFDTTRQLLEKQNLEGNFLSPSINYLSSKTRQVEFLPQKSPVLSGLFSAVVPGLGQGYCERWGDALYSFVLSVGGLASSYYFWDRDRKFAIFTGTLGSFFYLGNIYGGIGAAILYNKNKKDEYIRKAHQEIPQPPEEILKGDINEQ